MGKVIVKIVLSHKALVGGLNGRITSSIVNIVTVPAQLFMRNTSCNPANLDIFISLLHNT